MILLYLLFNQDTIHNLKCYFEDDIVLEMGVLQQLDLS